MLSPQKKHGVHQGPGKGPALTGPQRARRLGAPRARDGRSSSHVRVASRSTDYRKTLYGDFCTDTSLSYKSLRKCFFI